MSGEWSDVGRRQIARSSALVVAIALLGCGGGQSSRSGGASTVAPATTSPVSSSQAAQATSSTTAASSTTPGTLVIVSPLTLDKSTVGAGDTLNATVTYANTGGSAVSVTQAMIVPVAPGSSVLAPFAPIVTATTVQPGGTLTLSAQRSFTANDPSGAWTAHASFSDSNGVVSVTADAPFTVDSPFVRVDRSKAQFTLDGKPFYFAGTNAYYLEQELAYGNTVALDALDAAKTAGFRVVRTWGFNNNTTGTTPTDPAILQISPGVYQASAWKAFDTVVAEAGKRGLHLIVNLVNNWDDYGGMNQYVTWAGLSGHDLFYTNASVKQLYKNYVHDFVTHVNTITGVAYKDDPTIFGWELANEARCNSDLGAMSGTLVAWYTEMSAYLKSQDSNHLVATGEEGCDVSANGYTPLTSYTTYFAVVSWTFGTSFTQNTALPDIDWASLHLYPDLWHWLDAVDDGNNWILDHTHIAGAQGKPLLLGEYGLETSAHSIYKTWLDTVASTNTAGALVWEFIPASRNAQTTEASNVVFPTDATDVANQSAAAAILNAK